MPWMLPALPTTFISPAAFSRPGAERAIAELNIGDFSRAKAVFKGFDEEDFALATGGFACLDVGLDEDVWEEDRVLEERLLPEEELLRLERLAFSVASLRIRA